MANFGPELPHLDRGALIGRDVGHRAPRAPAAAISREKNQCLVFLQDADAGLALAFALPLPCGPRQSEQMWLSSSAQERAPVSRKTGRRPVHGTVAAARHLVQAAQRQTAIRQAAVQVGQAEGKHALRQTTRALNPAICARNCQRAGRGSVAQIR